MEYQKCKVCGREMLFKQSGMCSACELKSDEYKKRFRIVKKSNGWGTSYHVEKRYWIFWIDQCCSSWDSGYDNLEDAMKHINRVTTPQTNEVVFE